MINYTARKLACSRYPFEWTRQSLEEDRLRMQAAILDRHSAAFLTEAGLKPGMHVADLGCGGGDSTVVLARIVGEHGRVLAVDTDERALEVCRAHCVSLGLKNISYMNADISTLSLSLLVDAAYARLVLAYVSDCNAVIDSIRQSVRPGGILCFEELDHSDLPEVPSRLAEWRSVHAMVIGALKRSNVHLDMRTKLLSHFPTTRASAPYAFRLSKVAMPPEDFCRYMYLVVTQIHDPALQEEFSVFLARRPFKRTVWDDLCERTLDYGQALELSPLVSMSVRV